MSQRSKCWILALLIAAAGTTAHAQPVVEEYATGFVNPIGLTADANGNLWVAEQGTGSGTTSRVSVVTPDGQVHPFLTGIPSNTPAFEPIGAEHVAFDSNGKALVLSAAWGTGPLNESILVVDTTGFLAGGTPRSVADRDTTFPVGPYVRAQGGVPNPYRIVVLANGDWLVVDASYNGIIRRELATGTLSDFCKFSPIGQSEAVPTGITFDGTDFFVGTLTGLPVPPGAAKVFKVTAAGAQSEFKGGFTAIVDLAINPVDGSLFVLQHARFAGGWADGTGSLLRIRGGRVDTLLVDMRRPSGMAFTSDGTLYLSSYSLDNVVKVTGLNTVVEPAPAAVAFGPVLTSVPDTLSFSIRNLDTLSHSVTGIAAPGSAYTLVNPPTLPMVIMGRSSVKLRVAFQPGSVGAFPDSVVIFTDDPARPSFAVPLSGSGAAITATAVSGVMYAVKFATPSGQVNTIDVLTGAAADGATFGLDKVDALAIQRGTGAMYGSVTSPTSTALYRIDPATGGVALSRRLPVGNMTALTFGSGDTLYGGTSSGQLLLIDLAAATYIQTGPASGIPYYSFALSPTTGELWASARATPDNSDTLYRVDPGTGVAHRVGRTGASLRSSLAFDSTGTLFALSGGSNTLNILMTIDLQTGTGAMIGSETYQNFCAIAIRVDGVVTDVTAPSGSIPVTFGLDQNYPNPFNPDTQIRYQIPEAGHVTLSVYDMLGREVAVLVDEQQAGGSHSALFKGRGLASGAYMYVLHAGSQVLTRKLTLVK